MSEDDRAAKAARAKAMLKKRQQKKAGPLASNSGIISPTESLPASRAMSPAPVPHGTTDEGINESRELTSTQSVAVVENPQHSEDVSELFRNISPASSWPATVENITSPPPPNENEDAMALLQNQRQTISLLVSEKASITESLERLEGVDAKLQMAEQRLEEEIRKSRELGTQLGYFEKESKSSVTRQQEMESTNTQLREKLTELERELHVSRVNVEDLRAQVEKRDRRARELEEQLQNDDRLERLEKSLRDTQDRADELEFQLSKLKQAHSKLKSESEGLESELRLRTDGEDEWKQKHTALEQNYTSSQQQVAALTSEQESLITARSDLQSQLNLSQTTLTDVQQKLSQAVSDLAASSRQLENALAEQRSASRRADDAEKAQRELQNEGTTLMHSLDEMRTKTVELTGIKLEMTEKVDSLDRELRQTDAAVTQLEGEVEQLQQLNAESSQRYHELERVREQEKGNAEESMSELQRAYVELQAQLEDAIASARELDSDRTHGRQSAVRQQEEIERLVASQQARLDEIATLRKLLEERSKAQEEEQRLFREAQTDVETLRSELLSKEEEITRLRDAVSSPVSPSNAPQTLDEEMMSALKQQHALDLSTAQSQIRNLETSVYDAEARAHALQKQVSGLEDELTQLRSASRHPRPFSPVGVQNLGNRGFPRPDDLRRSSFASQRSNSISVHGPSQLDVDQNLPPATRHQRRVSLAMLKARMDSEVESASHHSLSHPPSRAVSPSNITRNGSHKAALSTVIEPVGHGILDGSQVYIRPHFLDESHVFWCASCKGDLIVL